MIAGAGTMGSGIALSAALSGYNVILFDVYDAVLQKAKTAIESNLQFLLSKQKISGEEATNSTNRISFTSNIADCKADLVIEAIIEKLDTKIALLLQMAKVNKENTILATNTSSLSVNAIQQQLPNPGRVIGMHFFNPANIMKLVEVIKGAHTNEHTLKVITDVCVSMGKTPAVCTDAPGFIVNRVARHFYLESLLIAEKNIAQPGQIDIALEAAGFKMGAFKLMDLIGIDVNFAVTTSLYNAFNKAERFKPSPLQKQKIEDGDLGRKTGKGFFTY